MQTPSSECSVRISVAEQTLTLVGAAGNVLARYPVSTSRFGIGSEPGSFRTPLGRFRIGQKIGEGEALGSVFKSRLPTGENGLGAPDEDLILTRILWLEGIEPENANTRERYIYIHGTNHEEAIGRPESHGCVRMRNADVAELFARIAPGTEVRIEAA